MELWEDSVLYLTLATSAGDRTGFLPGDSRPIILTTAQPASSGLSLPKTRGALRPLPFRQAREPLVRSLAWITLRHSDKTENQRPLVQGEPILETTCFQILRHAVKTLNLQATGTQGDSYHSWHHPSPTPAAQ